MTTLPPDATARWMRMYGQTRATAFGFSLYEMKVFALESTDANALSAQTSSVAQPREKTEDESEGIYEVVHDFVTLRGEPTRKGGIFGTIKKGACVYATPFKIGVEDWVKLSPQTLPLTQNPFQLTDEDSRWIMIDATNVPELKAGVLLRRLGTSTASEDEKKLGVWRVTKKGALRERPSETSPEVGSRTSGGTVLAVSFALKGQEWLRVQNQGGHLPCTCLWMRLDDGSAGAGQLLERLRDAGPEAFGKVRPKAKAKATAGPKPSTRPLPPKPLDAPWLASHGGLPSPPSACTEVMLDADVDVGMASQCTMLRVTPADGGPEVNYVAKRGATNGDMSSCEREYRFYTEVARHGLAPGAPQPTMLEGVMRVARCFCPNWGKAGKEKEGFILILECLGEPDWVPVDPEMGCTFEQSVAAVESLGRFHQVFASKRWQEELGSFPLTIINVDQASHIQFYFSHTLQQAKSLVDLLPPGAQKAAERMSHGGLVECFERLADPPVTLNHGDYRPENLRFSAPGRPAEVGVFDWGMANVARGVADFTYFLMLSMRPEDRRQREQELIERYLAARGETGKKAVDAFREDLKPASLAILAIILCTRQGIANQSGYTKGTRIMLSRMMRWVGEAIIDWNSIDVLPDWL